MFPGSGNTNVGRGLRNSSLFFRNGLISGLRELDYAKGALGDIRVPFEVAQYVDQGLNPQSYTKDCMEKAIQKNEEVKGKIDAFKVRCGIILTLLSGQSQ